MEVNWPRGYSEMNPVRVRRADGKVAFQGEGHHHEDWGAHGHVRDHVHVRQQSFGVWKIKENNIYLNCVHTGELNAVS